jgi:small-conductance mechanosensitive channel
MMSNFLLDTKTIIEFSTIVVSTIVGGYLFDKYLNKIFLSKSSIIDADPTNYFFLKHLSKAIIYLLGFGWALLTLPITQTFGHSLLAGAGVTTIIAGFASQQALSNIVGGIFILMFKPFRLNDYIEFQGKQGVVVEVNLHDTIIEDDQQNKVVIPNMLISNGIITNYKNKPNN